VDRSQILPETVALEQEAVPHAAIPDCTHHFFLVKMLRDAEFNSTRVVQAIQLFGGEFQIQTGEIVLELRYLPRSYDRDYWHRSMAQRFDGATTRVRLGAMPRPVCSEIDFTADMIGAARCSPGRNSFITSLVIRPPSALPSP